MRLRIGHTPLKADVLRMNRNILLKHKNRLRNEVILLTGSTVLYDAVKRGTKVLKTDDKNLLKLAGVIRHKLGIEVRQ